ncbi:MAG: cytochrome c4 [Proteobacteria bacterium]|nr:MAG: cytochrome c4 [Pseudomonadota bacterium]
MKKTLMIVFASLAVTVSATSYAKGDATKGKALAATCAACHGADGNSTNPEWPKLAGQGEAYIAKQLRDYRSGVRSDAVMSAQAKLIASDEDVDDIAAYFASQTAKPGAGDKDKVEEGSLLYKGGKMSSKITACSACHGPTGAGNDPAKFPKLSSQHTKYLITQLKLFRSGTRNNDAGQMMRNIAEKMSDKDMEVVAEYITGLQD